MAYSPKNRWIPLSRPTTPKSHPMGWAGRRVAIRTPTDEQLAVITVARNANSKAGATGWDLLSARKRRPSEISIREKAHTDQASHAAARVPIPPIPRPRSLAPSVTTPLYKRTAFRVSGQTPMVQRLAYLAGHLLSCGRSVAPPAFRAPARYRRASHPE